MSNSESFLAAAAQIVATHGHRVLAAHERPEEVGDKLCRLSYDLIIAMTAAMHAQPYPEKKK